MLIIKPESVSDYKSIIILNVLNSYFGILYEWADGIEALIWYGLFVFNSIWNILSCLAYLS